MIHWTRAVTGSFGAISWENVTLQARKAMLGVEQIASILFFLSQTVELIDGALHALYMAPSRP